jgi:O-antigen/teichoic acid export membrane protein
MSSLLNAPTTRQSLRWNIVANFFGQGWTALLSVALIPVYISYLGVEAYGLIGFHTTLQAWLACAGNVLSPVTNRQTAQFCADKNSNEKIWNQIRTLESVALCCAIAVSIFATALSPLIASYWLQPKSIAHDSVSTSVTLMGVVIAIRILESVYQGALSGLQRQVRLNLLMALTSTVRSLGAIGVLAWLRSEIEVYFTWQVFSSLTSVLALRLFAYRALPRPLSKPRLSREALNQLRNFSTGITISTVFALLLTQADKLILSKLLTLTQFGYYMLANTLASGLLLLMAPIAQAYYPRLSYLVATGDNLQLAKQYHDGSRLVTLCVAPACVLMAFFSNQILLTWSADRDLAEGTALLLTLLAVGNGIHSLMHMPYMLQLASGWSSLSARMNLVACIIFLPAILIAVPRYGGTAAAVIWLCLNAGYLLSGISLMHSRLLKGERRSWYMNDVTLPLLPVIIAAAILRPLYPDLLSRAMSTLALASLTLALYAIALVAPLLLALRSRN